VVAVVEAELTSPVNMVLAVLVVVAQLPQALEVAELLVLLTLAVAVVLLGITQALKVEPVVPVSSSFAYLPL
jgi:hypothetical protein